MNIEYADEISRPMVKGQDIKPGTVFEGAIAGVTDRLFMRGSVAVFSLESGIEWNLNTPIRNYREVTAKVVVLGYK